MPNPIHPSLSTSPLPTGFSTEHQPSPSPHQLDESISVGENPNFDEKETHYPLFFLAEPPNEYLKALHDHQDPSTTLLPTSSSAPSGAQLLTELKSHATQPVASKPMPFLNSTIPEVYTFFNSYLRNPIQGGFPHPFTDFTFLAVDGQCFGQSPLDYTILLCSDAPDFEESETEVRLKALRLSLANALDCLLSIDMLMFIPREAEVCPYIDGDVRTLRVWPCASFVPIEPYTDNEDQEYRVATPAEARTRKRVALMDAEAAGWVLGRGIPNCTPGIIPPRQI